MTTRVWMLAAVAATDSSMAVAAACAGGAEGDGRQGPRHPTCSWRWRQHRVFLTAQGAVLVDEAARLGPAASTPSAR
jgi:hypothetical protein